MGKRIMWWASDWNYQEFLEPLFIDTNLWKVRYNDGTMRKPYGFYDARMLPVDPEMEDPIYVCVTVGIAGDPGYQTWRVEDLARVPQKH